jgi:toxin ParE1/3/4
VTWQVIFEAPAQAEVAQAVAWHEQVSCGLGGDFLRMLAAVQDQLARNPRAFPPAQGRFRRILLRRFPYALHFELLGEHTVSVLACGQVQRPPALWSA